MLKQIHLKEILYKTLQKKKISILNILKENKCLIINTIEFYCKNYIHI